MLQQTPLFEQTSLVALRGKAPSRFPYGSARPRISRASFANTLIIPLNALPHETEDSVLTGGTRSLNRRLLALNLDGPFTRRPAESGHAPISFARSA